MNPTSRPVSLTTPCWLVLKESREEDAARLFHAAACGMVMTLLGMKIEERNLSLSEVACDMALAAIVTDQNIYPAPNEMVTAIALRALLTSSEAMIPSGRLLFTKAERGLLAEWLGRLVR